MSTEAKQADEPQEKRRNESQPNDDDEEKEDEEEPRGFEIFGVRFAPFNTPLRRRLQTLVVAQALFTMAILPLVCCFVTLLLLLSPAMPLVLLYLGWMLLCDRDTPCRGGRRRNWVRRWPMWRLYRDYFPIKLVKTGELPMDANYLIGYHPHGIVGCGAFCNFSTEATGFSRQYPGIKPHLVTLKMNFFFPFLREYYLAIGLCDVSSKSLQWLLGGRQGNGNAAVVVIGGAQEALDARPGSCQLTLKNRKGFVRLALKTGAQLVPCYSFGENELFKQANNPPGSMVRSFQQLFKGMFGSSPPLFYGRGIFNYSFGAMPFRRTVATVVGRPIAVERVDKPTDEQVDSLHEQYMQQLKELFDQHKEQFGLSSDAELTFV